jgi:hypothetical protein
VTRHYNSLEQIIQDVNGARIWAGFHYRSTLVRSNVLGRTVANWVNDNLMRPLDDYDDEGEDNDGHYKGRSVTDDNDSSKNAFPTSALSVSAQAPGAFKPIGNMTAPRAGHTATLLPNGKVLISGGRRDGLTNAELFDPAAATFTSTGEMVTARRLHTATLLTDGRVLIAGGFLNNSNSPLASAELYDPTTGTFTATGSMLTARGKHTATLLYDGRVLVAGSDYTAELYDPTTRTFTVTGAYAGAYLEPYVDTATLLPDGKVLITGCDCRFSTAPLTELFDPSNGTFGLTGGASGPIRWWVDVNAATLLRNGNVLIVGNSENDGSEADAELYSPSAGIFFGIGNTTAPHEFSTATLLPDGQVLIAGGQLPGGSGAAGTDLYDPATGKFSAAEKMTTSRHSHTATLLADGTALIAGGYSVWLWPNPTPSSSVELYVPPLLMPPLLVTGVRLDSAVVGAGASYSVNISGSGLNAETFFDVRFTDPENHTAVVLNWQKGLAANHELPINIASGIWTINGVRAHQIEADHTGSFVPVSATITVSP